MIGQSNQRSLLEGISVKDTSPAKYTDQKSKSFIEIDKISGSARITTKVKRDLFDP